MAEITSSEIAEWRLEAEAHKLKRRSAQIILSCLDEIERLRRKRDFKPPTISEVKAYAKEIGLPESECEPFYDHHDAYAWTGKKGRYKKWQALLRTWKRNCSKYGTGSNGSKPIQACPARWGEFVKLRHGGRWGEDYQHAPGYVKTEFAVWRREQGRSVTQ